MDYWPSLPPRWPSTVSEIVTPLDQTDFSVICGSGVFLFTGAISEDLAVLPAQQSWVIVSPLI